MKYILKINSKKHTKSALFGHLEGRMLLGISKTYAQRTRTDFLS